MHVEAVAYDVCCCADARETGANHGDSGARERLVRLWRGGREYGYEDPLEDLVDAGEGIEPHSERVLSIAQIGS